MKTTIALMFALVSVFNSFGQDYSVEAKDFFSKYLDRNSQMDLFKKSLPSLDECKLVFKDKSAYTFYGYAEEIKKELSNVSGENENFVECRIESFTTNDIEQGKGNYAGGMADVLSDLQPNVTFYRVTYLREKGAEHGVSYKYFVNIKGEWVLFPKPWKVLR